MAAPASQALSSGGKVLFGSLCAGTFVLGTWQTQRYFEKEVLIAAREEQMQLEPMTSISQLARLVKSEPFRRWHMRGTFQHKGEVLVGPRGIPPGALPKKSKPQGVMGDTNTTGPQGYFVVTPFDITEETATSKSTRTILVNRGWVPKEFVDQTSSTKGLWSRPEGNVSITGVPMKIEEPKWIKPQHDFSKKPLRLLYFDESALKVTLDRMRPPHDQHHVTEEDDKSIVLLTQIKDDNNSAGGKLSFPLQSPIDKVGEYKISPMIHAGYAATWFGLSGAGMYMTRKLLTRGRG